MLGEGTPCRPAGAWELIRGMRCYKYAAPLALVGARRASKSQSAAPEERHICSNIPTNKFIKLRRSDMIARGRARLPAVNRMPRQHHGQPGRSELAFQN